ncbi:MOSC domain-containing protein [Nesterenkonia salmonea]|uniref:MOSC domain-containing protein n=1 Tax=Nesterenkonia salmonea TaxID=1804987 RepID=A0A5R9BCB8_9MICC|nr:MOSC N-terminal beta barrel domain-containing protein [Nesterenkonia salmonea]TLP97438.1 MOSC domain-containing protein [Nesterenkonia salmonea]
MELTVISIRRYPVKAMGGESLPFVELDKRGLVGDRWYAVTDQDGKLASGKDGSRFRRHDAVFDYRAQTEDTTVRVTGPRGTWAVDEPKLREDLSAVIGAPVSVSGETEVPHYDGGAVSIIGSATLAWMAQQWGINADPRRLRVNVVLQTQKPFIEESWTGQSLDIGQGPDGAVRLSVQRRIPRCRTIDLDQDGAQAKGRLLKLLGQHREMCAAVYAGVVVPGRVTVGDSVRVGHPTPQVQS